MSNEKGVATVPPPAVILPTIMSQVNDVVGKMDPDQRLGATLSVRTTTGINFGVVYKLVDGKKVDVNGIGWFGKTWGGPVDAGVAVYLKIGD